MSSRARKIGVRRWRLAATACAASLGGPGWVTRRETEQGPYPVDGVPNEDAAVDEPTGEGFE